MSVNIFINEERPHDSASKHVSGYAIYTDDIKEPYGTLHGAIGCSKKAHAIIKKIDLSEVWKSEGVISVVEHNDISSVCASFNLEIVNKKIKNVKIAYGGMAPIPKRAINCEKTLINSSLSEESFEKAKKNLEKDFSPINDTRATKDYRMEVAKNLLMKCFIEIKKNKLIRLN